MQVPMKRPYTRRKREEPLDEAGQIENMYKLKGKVVSTQKKQ